MSSTSSSVLKLDYEYGATNQNNGNIRRQIITAPKTDGSGNLVLTQDYSYDHLNRLIGATETLSGASSWQQTYDIDRFGNRAVRNTSYLPTPLLTPLSTGANDFTAFDQAKNQLKASNGFGYDLAGNLTGDPTTGPNAMVYDAENRLTSYTKNAVTTTYGYDGDGRRVKKTESSEETVFVYNASGQLIAEYTTIDSTGPGGVSYLTADHLGSTRVVTDGNQQVKQRLDYLPFGEEIGSGIGGRSTAQGYSQADGLRQKWTGKERDSESGLDYFLARYYSSAQGRFTSPDPFGHSMIRKEKQDEFASNPQRWNKYVYVLNNPLRYVDPTGLAEVPTWNNLSKELQEDLAKRLGGATNAQEVWDNQFDNNKRQEVLNTRAVLIAAGVWENVTSVSFGAFQVEDNWGTENDRTTYTLDNKNGWVLAITTNKDIRSDLEKAGFDSESNVWNHPEGQWTYKQEGDDIVLHVVGLKKPADKFQTTHFDSGGGSIFSWEHAKDWWKGTGVTQDRVTKGLAGTPAEKHLKGISTDIDKLLAEGQKK